MLKMGNQWKTAFFNSVAANAKTARPPSIPLYLMIMSAV